MRPTFAEIDLGAIASNLGELRTKVSPAKLMAVVKANAYGHGVEEIARLAAENGADYFGVATLEEGQYLRTLQPELPILVFGGFFENQIDDMLRSRLEATLLDFQRAQALSERAAASATPARVHVKIDTGMGRVGVAWNEAVDLVKRVARLQHVEVVGMYTHLAESEQLDLRYSENQLARFREVVESLATSGIRVPLNHVANSGAVLNLPDSYFDMVRVGLSMYGYYPATALGDRAKLKPAMALKSRVIAVRRAPSGSYISYNRTFRTTSETEIATVPIGYGDGFSRALSNRADVLVRGRRCPVVGRVCMDQIMVDLGLGSGIEVGEEVVLLGRHGAEEITIYEFCEKLNTIPYEVASLITSRVPRIYVN